MEILLFREYIRLIYTLNEFVSKDLRHEHVQQIYLGTCTRFMIFIRQFTKYVFQLDYSDISENADLCQDWLEVMNNILDKGKIFFRLVLVTLNVKV